MINSFVHMLIRTFSFFPSITFNVVPAEIFPWGVILFLLKKTKFFLWEFFVLLGFVFWTIVGIQNGSPGEAVKTLFSYLNPILVLFYILHVSSASIYKMVRIAKGVLLFLIAVGCMQIMGLLGWLEFLFDAIVSRGGTEAVGGGRGVSLFSTEPSRAGVEIIFVYALLRFYHAGVKYVWFYDALIFIFVVLVIKSAVALGFLIVFFFLVRPKISLVLIFIAAVFSLGSSDVRSLAVLSQILSSSDIATVLKFVFNQSGFRLISVFSSYNYALLNAFGSGIGSWPVSIVDALNLSGFSASEISYFRLYFSGEFSSVKPTAYAALLFLETGLLYGIILSCIFVAWLIHHVRVDRRTFALTTIFFLYVFFMGAVGNPVPWIAYGLMVRLSTLARGV